MIHNTKKKMFLRYVQVIEAFLKIIVQSLYNTSCSNIDLDKTVMWLAIIFTIIKHKFR